jgi:hypothetical protein
MSISTGTGKKLTATPDHMVYVTKGRRDVTWRSAQLVDLASVRVGDLLWAVEGKEQSTPVADIVVQVGVTAWYNQAHSLSLSLSLCAPLSLSATLSATLSLPLSLCHSIYLSIYMLCYDYDYDYDYDHDHDHDYDHDYDHGYDHDHDHDHDYDYCTHAHAVRSMHARNLGNVMMMMCMQITCIHMHDEEQGAGH